MVYEPLTRIVAPALRLRDGQGDDGAKPLDAAIAGAIGHAFIDIAGHAGGFVTGIVIGLWIVRPGSNLPIDPHLATKVSDLASTVLIGGAATLCLVRMLG